ncbi:hypothetical protein EDC94DRAFT_659483 [Helicostylum pulchrum]|nr:hypothetical protein EDC94DRAFT_659483 [Helicostylum pulchrum]
MSKHVLLDNEVMNLITTQLIGENNQYYPRPTEWINGKKSDDLYATDDSNASPPVLIEVQNVADDAFLHRVVGYCGKVYEEHGVVPVVLIVVVKKIRDIIMRKATKDTTHPFLFKLPCFPWAKKCFFISTESIRDHLTEIPLSPLVALGAYFTSQKTSILDHSLGHDPTIQMLYNLSQRIFENIAVNENTTLDDLLSLCQKSDLKIKEGIKALEESTGTSANKRAVDCLNDGLEIVKSYSFKYMSNELSPATSPASSPVPSPVPASSPELEPSSRNWEFVHNYIQSLGNERMNWNACFVECQRQGVLSNYTKPSSLKNAYQRWKKQQT